MRPPRAARLQRPNELVDDASDCQQAQEAPKQKEHQLHGLFRRRADEGVKADSGSDQDDDGRHGDKCAAIARPRQSVSSGESPL